MGIKKVLIRQRKTTKQNPRANKKLIPSLLLPLVLFWKMEILQAGSWQRWENSPAGVGLSRHHTALADLNHDHPAKSAPSTRTSLAPCRPLQGALRKLPITPTASASLERVNLLKHRQVAGAGDGAGDPLVVVVKNMLTPPTGDTGKTAEGKTSWKSKNVNIARGAKASKEKLHQCLTTSAPTREGWTCGQRTQHWAVLHEMVKE